jgi:hypothetical protein
VRASEKDTSGTPSPCWTGGAGSIWPSRRQVNVKRQRGVSTWSVNVVGATQRGGGDNCRVRTRRRAAAGALQCIRPATSASTSMHPVGVIEHVHAHHSKDDEHNHGGHDPHDPHFGFFSVLLILVCHRFLLLARAQFSRSCPTPVQYSGNLIVHAYSSLTERPAATVYSKAPRPDGHA